MEELELENHHRKLLHGRLHHRLHPHPPPPYQQHHHRSGLRTREPSPDSVILALESHFSSSLFSSSAPSVDRLSFASDADASLHLAGSEREGPDPDPNNASGTASAVHHKLNSFLLCTRQAEKAKVQKEDHDCHVGEDQEEEEEEGHLPLDSARSSFSLALKECNERRSRSETQSGKSDRRRPASVDFNNGSASSPRMGPVKTGSTGSRKSGTFPSPGTPNYRNPSIGLQKGWSSERVPLQSNTGMKSGGAAYLPFNHNGRTLPSKWEDAERWIFSPVYAESFVKPLVPPPHRRPKSKSGPLGPPGVTYHSLYSPATSIYEGGNMGNFMARSPLCTGVMGADGFRMPGSNGGSYQVRAEPCMGRSVSIHGYSDLPDHQSSAGTQDGSSDQLKDAATDVSRAVSRRDMATQMSPHGSTCSSPGRSLSFSASPPNLQIVELLGVNSPKLEMKDVQVDERVILTGRLKKSKCRIIGKGSGTSDEWKTKAADVQSCVWDVSDPVKSISKTRREEAKITAWENLQKAKAEASIRKLEMKLEKKRSSSMDKIMKKLRSAQKRAQEMRSSAVTNQAPPASNNPHKALIFRRSRPVGSLGGCFTCHAF
ncbi:hypothetical protein MLD38_012956 [Melastoma candidum]|uniref:Uncharacterized protein n=1 Tax=Melastoma candidum TaxID=119954 RepID=A0ACB9R952_9MYRT|nr:hypothetical protein MLD38_012956 [Melastoma candidum]